METRLSQLRALGVREATFPLQYLRASIRPLARFPARSPLARPPGLRGWRDLPGRALGGIDHC